MLILCEDMFCFGGVRVPIYSLFVLCLGPNVAGSVCPSIHFSFCVLGSMLPDLCAHLFTFRSVSWALCCRVRVPIYLLFVLCLGPNVAGSVCPSIHFSFCVLGPMLPGPCAHLFTFRSVSWAQCCRVRVPIYSLFVLCLGPNVACVSSLSILDFPNVYFVENNYNCNIIITTFNLLLALPKEKKRRFSNLFTVNVLD